MTKEDDFPTDPAKLREACERHSKLVADTKVNKTFQTGYFDVDKLEEVIRASQSKHVKVYYGIDERNKHFLFIAPTQEDGSARDDIDTTAALCCCQTPPCPRDQSDRFANSVSV